MQNLERITLLENHVGFKALREEANAKLVRMEKSISRLLFLTRTEVDPIEIEYFRGFRQGVKYVLDGLPGEVKAEFERELAKSKESK